MAYDYDFIGFTYNGKHSIDDFGIYRTSDGNRYNDNLVPQMTDKTADVPGGDGQYYFYTHYKSRQFSIPIAFDNLSESKYREMRNWLNGKEIRDLIFDECPYKVYSAKVTGTPQLKTLCFEINGQREYRGEGTIQFTCYYPFAHTPTTKSGEDGRSLENYLEEDYPTKSGWSEGAGMLEKHVEGINLGDVPSNFIFKYVGDVAVDTKFVVGNLEITIKEACSDLTWDSKTGLVIATPAPEGETIFSERPIHYTGTSYGTIPVTTPNEPVDIYYFYKQGDQYYRMYINKNIFEYDAKNKELKGRSGRASSLPFTIEYNYWYY